MLKKVICLFCLIFSSVVGNDQIKLDILHRVTSFIGKIRVIYLINERNDEIVRLIGDKIGTGVVIAIERDYNTYEELKRSIVAHKMWDQSLVVYSASGTDVLSSESNKWTYSIREVASMLGDQCAEIVILNDGGQDGSEVVGYLAGLREVITRCNPMMIFDVSKIYTSGSALRLLKNENYALFWVVLDDVVSIVAVPSKYQRFAESLEYERVGDSWFHPLQSGIESVGNESFVNNSIFFNFQGGQVFGEIGDYNCTILPADGEEDDFALSYAKSLKAAAGGSGKKKWTDQSAFLKQFHMVVCDYTRTYQEDVAFQVRDLLPEFSESLRLLRMMDKTGEHVEHEVVLPFRSETLPPDHLNRVAALKHLALALCLTEIETFYSDLVRFEKESDAMPAAVNNSRLLQERMNTTRSCVDFGFKQLLMVNDLICNRELFAVQLSHAQMEVSASDEDERYRWDSLRTEYHYLPVEAGESREHPLLSQFLKRSPFEMRYEAEICGEPVWCSHTARFQELIERWQLPDTYSRRLAARRNMSEEEDASNRAFKERTCDNSRFLVFHPPTEIHGLGSMLIVMASAFRVAVCLKRILVLLPIEQDVTLTKWRMPGCEGNSFDCYFQPLTECEIKLSELENAIVSQDGDDLDAFPWRNERVVVLKGLPTRGKCALCFEDFDLGDSPFFDGVYPGGRPQTYYEDKKLLHFSAFLTTIKATWLSQFLRYLMRPRPWLAASIERIVRYALYSKTALESEITYPRQFASLHVRYGMKIAEADPEPLTRYMNTLQRKAPFVRDIFLSTETEAAIEALMSEYPQYRYHFLRYPRIPYLDLKLCSPTLTAHTDFVSELLYSLSNLYVASEADAFVGTLSSNWCMMIHHLERTRGDGGVDYQSIDKGSAFTGCF